MHMVAKFRPNPALSAGVAAHIQDIILASSAIPFFEQLEDLAADGPRTLHVLRTLALLGIVGDKLRVTGMIHLAIPCRLTVSKRKTYAAPKGAWSLSNATQGLTTPTCAKAAHLGVVR